MVQLVRWVNYKSGKSVETTSTERTKKIACPNEPPLVLTEPQSMEKV